MECRKVRQLADAFVSEQLLVETTQAIVVHLDHCPGCRAEIAGLRRLRAAAQSAFSHAKDLEPRPEFLSSLAARLQVEATQQRHRTRWLRFAAGVLLVVGSGFAFREWSVANLATLIHAAVGDHRFCALDFKLAEQPISLDEAAARFGSLYRVMKDVEPSTTTLSEGTLRVVARHSCIFDGHRFAHIVLEYRGQVVSLLVATTSASWVWNGAPAASDGLHVTTLRASRYMAFVVSALDEAAVREVAAAFARPMSRALAGI